jgi:predicted RND superfamily exporter protein
MAFASPVVLETLQAVEQVLDRNQVTAHPLSILNVLRTIPGADGDFVWKARLLAGLPEELTERFVRADLRRAIVVARMPDLGCAAYQQVFANLESELARIDTAPGIRATLTGTPVLAARNINQMILDLAVSLSLAVVVIFWIITLAFRSWRIGLISVVPNMFPLAATSALLVVTGRPLQLSSVLVFTICLGIAVDDTIHYLNRFVYERRQRSDVTLALRRCSAAVGTALVTSTLVLLAAFGSLLASEIPTTRAFAELACTAIAAALVGDLVFLPPLLKCFAGEPRRPSIRNAAYVAETVNAE